MVYNLSEVIEMVPKNAQSDNFLGAVEMEITFWMTLKKFGRIVRAQNLLRALTTLFEVAHLGNEYGKVEVLERRVEIVSD